MKITDTQRIDYLECTEYQDDRGQPATKQYIVFDLSGRAYHGRSFRKAVDKAFRHDLKLKKEADAKHRNQFNKENDKHNCQHRG